MSRPATPFPQHMRLARERRQLSQKDLARLAGLPPSAVSHFESGARAPSLHNVLRLADALGVTTDFLLGRTVPAAWAGPLMDHLSQVLHGMAIADVELLVDFAILLAHRRMQRVAGDGQAVPTRSQQGHGGCDE